MNVNTNLGTISLRLGVAFATVVVIAAVGGGIYWYQRDIAISDLRAAKWRQLATSVATLKRGEFPQSWLAGAYVSNNMFSALVDAEKGTSLEVTTVKGYEDLVLTIDGAKLASRAEAPEINLELSAASKKNRLAVRLNASGVLVYRGVSASSTEDVTKADFGIVLTALSPQISWTNFKLGTPAALRELVATGVMRTVGDKLVIAIPVTSKLDLSYGGAKDEDIPIKETGGSIKAQWVTASTKISKPIAYTVPLYTDQGIWLLATDQAALPPMPSGPEHPTESDLATLRETLITMLPSSAKPTGDAAVWLNNRLVLAVVGELAALDQEHRTVVLRSVKATGNLFEKRWRDDVLGEGGTFLRPANDQFAVVTAKFGTPSATWVPKQGIDLALPVSVSAEAKVHWHVDPLVGGGYGNDLGLSGSVAQTLRARIGLQLVKLPKAELAVFAPALECVNVPIEVAASGDIKVSVKAGFLAFDKPTTPSVFMDPLPRRVALRNEKDAKAPRPDAEVRVNWRLPDLDITLTPFAVKATDLGFYVEAKAAIAPAANNEADIKARRDALVKELTTYWDGSVQQKCPKPDDVRVTVAGIEIGPDALPVQLIKQVADVIDRTGKEVNKFLTTPGKALEDSLGNVKREANEVLKHIDIQL